MATQTELARMVAAALSGVNRLDNVKHYGSLIRIHGMAAMDALWAAASIADRAPIAAALNVKGTTARDHNRISRRLAEFAERSGSSVEQPRATEDEFNSIHGLGCGGY